MKRLSGFCLAAGLLAQVFPQPAYCGRSLGVFPVTTTASQGTTGAHSPQGSVTLTFKNISTIDQKVSAAIEAERLKQSLWVRTDIVFAAANPGAPWTMTGTTWDTGPLNWHNKGYEPVRGAEATKSITIQPGKSGTITFRAACNSYYQGPDCYFSDADFTTKRTAVSTNFKTGEICDTKAASNEYCLGQVHASHTFSLSISIASDAGAVIGSLFADTGFWNGLTQEQFKVFFPLNGGRPF